MKIRQLLESTAHNKELEFYSQLENALLRNHMKYPPFFRDGSSTVQELFDVKWDGSGFIVEADETCQDTLKVMTDLKSIESKFPCWMEIKEFIGGIEFLSSISLYDDASKMIPAKVNGLTLRGCSLNVNSIKKLEVEYGLILNETNICGHYMDDPVIFAGNFMIENAIGAFSNAAATDNSYEPFSAFSPSIIKQINQHSIMLIWNEDYMHASPDDLITAVKIGLMPAAMIHEGVNKRKAVLSINTNVDFNAGVRRRVMKATQILAEPNLEKYSK